MPIHLHQFTHQGGFHENHCEDYALSAEIGEGRMLLAVMDGCTMGTESYFASTLMGKLLRKIARQEDYRSYYTQERKDLPVLLRLVVEQLFNALVFFSSELALDKYELLSTLVITVVDIRERTAFVRVFGDGVVFYNDTSTVFEQANAPDYIGYHLLKDFDEWYQSQSQMLELKHLNKVVLSTDGVFTFAPFTTTIYPELSEEELFIFLFVDDSELKNERMYWKKMVYLEQVYGLRPTDDIGMVRLDWLSD